MCMTQAYIYIYTPFDPSYWDTRYVGVDGNKSRNNIIVIDNNNQGNVCEQLQFRKTFTIHYYTIVAPASDRSSSVLVTTVADSVASMNKNLLQLKAITIRYNRQCTARYVRTRPATYIETHCYIHICAQMRSVSKTFIVTHLINCTVFSIS